jgi:hypothetical protein
VCGSFEWKPIGVDFLIVCLDLYYRWKSNYQLLTCLIPPYCCTCLKPAPVRIFKVICRLLFIVQWLNVRCSCSFCWYWWNWWPSLWTHGLIIPLSYRKRETMERVWENEENKRELTRTYKIMAKWENMKRQIIVNKSLHIKLKIGKHYFH